MTPADPRLRVLLVEDDPDVAGFTRTVLERRGGMICRWVTNPADALEVLASAEVDVVVTDIEMPGMTGLELLGHVRATLPHVPVVVMTAYAQLDYAVEALRQRADEFLVKPVPAATLVERVREVADAGRAARIAARPRDVVLAVGAHPDDVEIGVGGTLAAHRAIGDTIVILTMSHGGRGGDEHRRQTEALAAAEIIGARLFLEDLEDTEMSPGGDTVRRIERVVAEVSPTVVYTHSRHDRHQDHRAVYLATSAATRQVPTFACYQSPSTTTDFHPNRFVAIDDHVETKLRMLAAFGSQEGRAYLEPDMVRATARYWSRFGGGTWCEPLEVVRDTSAVAGAPRGSTLPDLTSGAEEVGKEHSW